MITVKFDEMDCFRRICFLLGRWSSSISAPAATPVEERLGTLYRRLVSEDTWVLFLFDKNDMFYFEIHSTK